MDRISKGRYLCGGKEYATCYRLRVKDGGGN